MKFLFPFLFLLFVVFFSSCDKKDVKEKIVLSKSGRTLTQEEVDKILKGEAEIVADFEVEEPPPSKFDATIERDKEPFLAIKKPLEPGKYINAWKSAKVKKGSSWVLFEYGTCVFVQSSTNVKEKSLEILERFGPVSIASPPGDFAVYPKGAIFDGWAVTFHHPDIVGTVLPEEILSKGPGHGSIGFFARNKRELDAKNRRIIHVELAKSN